MKLQHFRIPGRSSFPNQAKGFFVEESYCFISVDFIETSYLQRTSSAWSYVEFRVSAGTIVEDIQRSHCSRLCRCHIHRLVIVLDNDCGTSSLSSLSNVVVVVSLVSCESAKLESEYQSAVVCQAGDSPDLAALSNPCSGPAYAYE